MTRQTSPWRLASSPTIDAAPSSTRPVPSRRGVDRRRVRVAQGALIATSCAIVIASVGCGRIDRFDTGDDEAYCGNVVTSSFFRRGFTNLPRLQLRLDTASLHDHPANISTDDDKDGICSPQATFEDAEMRMSQEMQADPVSQLEFGDAREMNLLGWVDSSCDGTYLAIVSLMRDDSVEVRLTRGERNSSGDEVGPFGVFRLTRHDGDCGFE